MKLLYVFLTGGILFSASLFSQTYPFTQPCEPASAKIDLDINNVRTTLMNGGDLWWDLVAAKYEIPKGGGAHSVFSGALWFGALDDMGNIMTAAQTYRQTGNDFWPGPVDTTYALTNDSICQLYDRCWKLNRSEVEAFTQHYHDTGYTIPEAILSWPGNGNTVAGHAHYLAPFHDADGDGIYNPLNGDYPAFALNGPQNCNTDLLGDQAIWWVFNDAGNDHSETGSLKKFGMEVHAMAFAFHTNDALNDATLYRYQVINRSTKNWNQMWIGQYADCDVGAYDDDYVGCDVSRGMGYQYNGDLYDGQSQLPSQGTYGEHPPAIGFDFLEGPLADANDLLDNDRDSVLDEAGERIKLSMLKYYDGDFTVTGNPDNSRDFYYFLQGKWKDGLMQTYGGSAYGGSTPCMFMLPGNSDPYGWGTGGVPQSPWYETVTPFDRRFIESVGPFTMSPGEVQTVVIGVPWARDTAGTNLDAITKLQQADDYIQQMFDNCFANLPCSSNAAPDFTFTQNGKTIYFTAEAANGNYSWDFGDNNFSNVKHPAHSFTSGGTYHVCLTVTNACGSQSVCHEIVLDVPVNECGPAVQRLEGKGSGNMVLDFMQESIDSVFTSGDQRVHFPWYKSLHAPVKITYENYVNMINGDYRIAFDSAGFSSHWKMWIVGKTDTVYADSTIGSGNKQIIPQWGIGVTIQQVDLPGLARNPDRNGFLEATMTFADPSKKWLTGIVDDDTHSENNWIRSGDFIGTGSNPCAVAWDDRFVSSVPLDANEDFENMLGGTWAPYRLTANNLDPLNHSTICYTTGPAYWNTATMLANRIDNISNVDVVLTSDKSKWTRCVVFEIGSNLAMNENNQPAFLLRSAPSVDKNGHTVAQGGISDVNNPEAADYIGATGMGWFPGYAINIETGERLNMAFGENSALTGENGRDMIWNPTSAKISAFGDPLYGGMHYTYVFGHNGDMLYSNPYPNAPSLAGELKDVPVYDAGKMMYKILTCANVSTERTEIFRDAMWVNIPLVVPGHQLFETDVTVRLRVAKPFKAYNTSSSPENNDYPLYGFKIDKYNLGCNFYGGAVMAFPNPFNETCTIMFDNTDHLACTLSLYDVRGRLVRFYDYGFSDRFVISSTGLEEGIYIYSLQKGNEKAVTGKIILR
jgi:PKD repeat protein